MLQKPILRILPLASALQALKEAPTAEARTEVMANIIIAGGGIWMFGPDQPEGMAEISLCNVVGLGETAEQATADWMAAAARTLEHGVCILWYARQVQADCTQHDDVTVAEACRIIEARSDDPTESARARDLRVLIEGEAA
ncbi:hypothetical protein [Pacificoceanicola onchidii]|uniref:hypothetical protein n=1 Tax=Pacificoceanicola onchidii TaxID=2562685 RepID=UPI0010A442E2|nr:hypothetical protein [Pacificoceanicola onchidii]